MATAGLSKYVLQIFADPLRERRPTTRVPTADPAQSALVWCERCERTVPENHQHGETEPWGRGFDDEWM